MKSDYSDIIHLPHHVSKTHPQMSMHDRAAQFSPFAALSGTVKKLDLFQRILTLEDGMQIFLDDILSIEDHTSTTL